MLRFVMQSRRATFRVDPDEKSDSAEPELQEAEIREPVREPVAVGAPAGKAALLEAEPVLARRLRSRLDAVAEPVEARIALTAEAVKHEARPTAKSAAVAEPESRQPEPESHGAASRKPSDLVLHPSEQARLGPELPAFRTSGLFAAHTEPEPAWWRAHPALIAGVLCMLLGVGLGMVMHRVVSAAQMQVGARVASTSSSAKPAGSVAKNATAATAGGSANVAVPRNGSGANAQPLVHGSAAGVGSGIMESPVGTVQTASVAESDRPGAQPAPLEGQSRPAPAGQPASTIAAPTEAVAAGKSSAVPVTVVKQVVTASPSATEDGPTGATQLTAATRSVVHPGSAGMTAANVIFSPAPEYPPAAAAAKVHGQVTVHAVVDPDGNVIYARAVSGPPLLRDAAQEAVHKWRYSPLLDNGKPIAVTTVAILDFKVAK
ncbi:MAG TPA: energy transducer TonB, partial [Terracidiphilus sp.]|nr:energy transducer TonB [Terracidiphilus sp.]